MVQGAGARGVAAGVPVRVGRIGWKQNRSLVPEIVGTALTGRRHGIPDDVGPVVQHRAHLIIRRRAVGEVHRLAALHGVDYAGAPTAPHVRAQPMAAGQLAGDRGGVIEGPVIAGEAALVPHIANVQPRGVAVGGFQMPGGEIDRLGPGERIQHIQAARVPFFQLGLQGVVAGRIAVVGDLDE